MSITAKPEIRRTVHAQVETTLTPVAFRASSHHPWRSYEPGNPKYPRDVERHLYTFDRAESGQGDVLYIQTQKFLGIQYETHCNSCGGYMIVLLPNDWKPAPVSQMCSACAAKSEDLQDATKRYTPEYQESMIIRPGVKR